MHCGCGVIKFNGRKLKLFNIPAQLKAYLPRDLKSASLFLISPKSVHIQNTSYANIHRVSQNIKILECRHCSHKIILYETNNTCFLLQIKHPTKLAKRQSDPLFFQPITHNIKTTDDKYIVDDSALYVNDTPFTTNAHQDDLFSNESAQDSDDFNFMFSANKDFIIGSYDDSMMAVSFVDDNR